LENKYNFRRELRLGLARAASSMSPRHPAVSSVCRGHPLPSLPWPWVRAPKLAPYPALMALRSLL